MPFNLGGPELMVILVIVLIVFGAGKLPNVMRDLGTGVREFKKAQQEDDAQPATPTALAASARPTTSATSATTSGAQAAEIAQPAHEAAAAPASASSDERRSRPVETSARA